ncbi:MAG: SpaA isopeptide-forming pilin-related protein, partial [Firmicutes bacterium]|nr:SpaA isopeptide-forming pilin-related protein [Bacillota bacterium]
KVMLIKVDADNPKVRLEGAVFEVYEDANGNGKLNRRDALVGTMKETEPGVHIMEDLPAGRYILVEKESPKGFALDKRVFPFEITGQEEAVLIENMPGVGFVNARRVGNLRILKSSSDGKKEGFTFRIEGEGYDETFVTDEKGEIFIENMHLNTYTITEVETEAAKGYKIPEPITVELVENETLRVDIFNEKVTITQEPPPKTGDSFLIAGIALAVLCAAGGCAFVMIRHRRKEEDIADETPA